jgi:hypothetical protein
MTAEMYMPGKPDNGIKSFNYEATPYPNELRETAKNIRNRTSTCVFDNGRDFSGWKGQLERGQFRRWVENECGFTIRAAELAISVWQYAEANGNREIISLLPPTIQYLVAAQSTPQSVRDEVLGTFIRGRRLKVRDVKELLLLAKGEISQPTLTIGPQSDEPRPAEEQAASVLPMTERQRILHQLAAWWENNTVRRHRPVDRKPETVGSVEEPRNGYLIEIIEILGTQVTAKDLLIELLDRAGYGDLALDYDGSTMSG